MTERNRLPEYEVYALRYARMPRKRRDNFIGGDPHDADMPMDFFVWLLRSGDKSVMVDTGFNQETARKRNRELLRCPVQALEVLGIEAAAVSDVIITHLHYDHAGNLDQLPNAKFHIQDAEMEYATGRCMCFEPMRHAYYVEDVITLVRNVYEDRVVFHDGNAVIAPGIELLKIGGHTKGLQSVRVHTARGWVVLASDASHYYENMQNDRPFPIVFNVLEMLAGYAKLEAAAQSPEHIIPGHDPLVMKRYPAHPQDADTVMLHLDPIAIS